MTTYADTQLANILREHLSDQIDKETAALIKSPTERRAGRIEAMQEVIKLVTETYGDLNEPKRQSQPV